MSIDLISLIPDLVTFLNSLGLFVLAVKKASK